jgi:flavin-dependent dehydrogenase
METCDVLIAGGGPAGSTCAWKLRQAGLDVVVVDRAMFPRDKVCAGWITPQVLADVDLDTRAYGQGRTFQPFTGFRVGLIGSGGDISAVYDHAVSFGIRRCEFDHYLLQRSGARLRLETSISSIRRDGPLWIVNDSLKTPMLVGAGGHFCPVARILNGRVDDAPLVVAQEAEFAIDPRDSAAFTVLPDQPELYFSRELNGYGWCLRKQNYLNIGFGHLDRRRLPGATAEFAAFLRARGKTPAHASWRWKGHAYLLSEAQGRHVIDDGVLLVGDAAGLAYPQSGEGIRPAIESGLIAASTIITAQCRYSRSELRPYEDQLRKRFGIGRGSSFVSQVLPRTLGPIVGPWLLRMPFFVRHVLLDRWFLHAHEPALALS